MISTVEELSSDTAPADHSTAQISGQTAPVLQVSVQAPAASSSTSQDASYVTSDQFSALTEKMAEQFAHFEALLSRGNIFSAPKMSVTPVSVHQVIYEKPFLDPSAQPTSPVRLPAELVDEKGSESKHEKKKSHKSKSKHKSEKKSHRHSDKQSDRQYDRSDALALTGDFSPSTSTAPAVT